MGLHKNNYLEPPSSDVVWAESDSVQCGIIQSTNRS